MENKLKNSNQQMLVKTLRPVLFMDQKNILKLVAFTAIQNITFQGSDTLKSLCNNSKLITIKIVGDTILPCIPVNGDSYGIDITTNTWYFGGYSKVPDDIWGTHPVIMEIPMDEGDNQYQNLYDLSIWTTTLKFYNGVSFGWLIGRPAHPIDNEGRSVEISSGLLEYIGFTPEQGIPFFGAQHGGIIVRKNTPIETPKKYQLYRGPGSSIDIDAFSDDSHAYTIFQADTDWTGGVNESPAFSVSVSKEAIPGSYDQYYYIFTVTNQQDIRISAFDKGYVDNGGQIKSDKIQGKPGYFSYTVHVKFAHTYRPLSWEYKDN